MTLPTQSARPDRRTIRVIRTTVTPGSIRTNE